MLSNDSNANGLNIVKLRATLVAENIIFTVSDSGLTNFIARYMSLDKHDDCVKFVRDFIGYVGDEIKPKTSTLKNLSDGTVLSLMISYNCLPDSLNTDGNSSKDEINKNVISCLDAKTARQNGDTSPTEIIDMANIRDELKALYPDIDWANISDDEITAMLNKAQSEAGMMTKANIYNRMYGYAKLRIVAKVNKRRPAWF